MLRFIGGVAVLWFIWYTKLLSLGLLILGNIFTQMGYFFG